jgi:hypothetical protein
MYPAGLPTSHPKDDWKAKIPAWNRALLKIKVKGPPTSSAGLQISFYLSHERNF